ADRNRSHWSTSKTPSYTKSVSWQHHLALNQQDFTDPRAMIALMRQLPSMDSIQLTVLRKGARHDISIALR
ncbi:hypothetical protein EXX53_21105, partial [Escherichia coli]